MSDKRASRWQRRQRRVEREREQLEEAVEGEVRRTKFWQIRKRKRIREQAAQLRAELDAYSAQVDKAADTYARQRPFRRALRGVQTTRDRRQLFSIGHRNQRRRMVAEANRRVADQQARTGWSARAVTTTERTADAA